MERLINRRQQGDLGEASAIEWFTRAGAVVSAPLGHSPDYDLIADFGDRPLRVQVKTSVCCGTRNAGESRWVVAVCTRGGNQSWQGTAKVFDATAIDLLFVLVGDGRRWLIPADAVQARINFRVGGAKYREFEIDPTLPIGDLIYGSDRAALDLRIAGGAPE